MPGLVTDTHALLWYPLESPKLSTTARDRMQATIRAGERLLVPTISLVEVVYLVEKGRLASSTLDLLNVHLANPDSGLELVPLDEGIARAISQIPRDQVPDMPDRLIAATALQLGVPLVSRDRAIQAADLETNLVNPDQDPVLVHDEGPVRIIRIYRPEVRNAIDAKTAKALRKASRCFEKDPDLRVGILTGGEEVFSAGADLADLDALVADIGGEHGPLGFTRHTLTKPTIAAIAGHCVAGGLEWACWCDLRIADTTAVFGFYERRFGVPLVDGGTQRLPRIIGLGRALDLILTGRPVSPEEARSIGLVNEIVPPGQALRRAVELANEIAAFPQMCLRQDRRAVYNGLDLPLAEGLKLEARLGAEVVGSGEPAAGAKSFREGKKRS